VQDAYTIDLARPTLLLALTWHHGGAFGHWGDEAELLCRLFAHIEKRGANLLVRLHDRHRYEPAYLELLAHVSRGRPHVQLKFKSDAPDSFVDLLISHTMLSNYSSMLNAFYYTGRPTVHIDPGTRGPGYYRRWSWGKLRKRRVDDTACLWKLDPGEVGGLRAQSLPDLLAAIDQALADPHCCTERARLFCDRYITGVDGHTCERIERTLAQWLRETPEL
jgi:hypothetical protein